MNRFQTIIVALVVLAAVSTSTAGHGDNCGQHCGCSCECQKICRLVCETKEVTKVTYRCKCEDFCVPGPSQRCQNDCNCGHCDSCNQVTWIPTCAEVKTRKVLVKTEEKTKKPSYRWVVEYLCPQCANGPVQK